MRVYIYTSHTSLMFFGIDKKNLQMEGERHACLCKSSMVLIGKNGRGHGRNNYLLAMTRKGAAAAVHLKGSLARTCRDHCTGGHPFAG